MKPQIKCYQRLNLLEHQLSDAPPTSRSITEASTSSPRPNIADSRIGAPHIITLPATNRVIRSKNDT